MSSEHIEIPHDLFPIYSHPNFDFTFNEITSLLAQDIQTTIPPEITHLQDLGK